MIKWRRDVRNFRREKVKEDMVKELKKEMDNEK